MSKASEVFDRFLPSGVLPVILINSTGQDCPEAAAGLRCRIPYRIEHPHSAIVHKHDGETCEDILYTPAGRLARKVGGAANGKAEGFVRRPNHFHALASFIEDMVPVMLPHEDDGSLPCLMSSPYIRLLEEWIDPALADKLMKEKEASSCLHLLDKLYAQEAALALSGRPPVLFFREKVTGSTAENRGWQRGIRPALKVLAEKSPETVPVLLTEAVPDPSLLPAGLVLLREAAPGSEAELNELLEELPEGGRIAVDPARTGPWILDFLKKAENE